MEYKIYMVDGMVVIETFAESYNIREAFSVEDFIRYAENLAHIVEKIVDNPDLVPEEEPVLELA